MSGSALVIVSGPPCSGKTSLGLHLAERFHLPFFHKDGVKELLFDQLGWGGREWSKKLSSASTEVLYYIVEVELRAGRSLILESNFKPELVTPKFTELQRKYDYQALQIMCRTQGEVLYKRFMQRAKSGERHAGHIDHLTSEELKLSLLTGFYAPLEIRGRVIEVDTTDFDSIDYWVLYEALAAMVA